jgi:hypothetical protein
MDQSPRPASAASRSTHYVQGLWHHLPLKAMAFEHVYAVWDYWDGIRSGFAYFQGAPHYFAALWDESADDYENDFQLTPVSPEIMRLVSEHCEIFRSWSMAFHRGQTTNASHPALPGQNERYAYLDHAIRVAITSANVSQPRVRGRFEALPNQQDLPPGVLREVCVEWSEP